MKYRPVPAYNATLTFLREAERGFAKQIYKVPPAAFGVWHDWAQSAHVFLFDFGPWSVDHDTDFLAPTQFSFDLITSGLFLMPHDNVFMCWPDAPLPDGVDGKPQSACALVITLMRRGEYTEYGRRMEGVQTKMGLDKSDLEPNLTVVQILGFSRPDGLEYAMLQDMSAIRSFASTHHVAANDHAIRYPMSHFVALNPLRGRDEQVANDAGVTMRGVCYFLGCLSARDQLRQETIRPDPALAARRIKEGRPPWVSYTSLSLPLLSGTVTPRGPLTGGRASPRLHWRRGHIRRVNDKLVAVSPTLVGSSAHGEVIKNYIVS